MKVFFLLSLVALATSASVKSSAPSSSSEFKSHHYASKAAEHAALTEAAEVALARTSTFASANNFIDNVAALASAEPKAVSALYKMVRSAPSTMDVASFVEALPYVSSFSPKVRSIMKNAPTEEIPKLTAAASALNALPKPAVAQLKAAGESAINEFVKNAKAVASLNAPSIVQLKSVASSSISSSSNSDDSAAVSSAIASNPAIANLKPATISLLRSVPASSLSKVVAAAQTVANNANAITPESVNALSSLSSNELSSLAEANEAVNSLTYAAAKMLKSLDAPTFSAFSDSAFPLSKLSPKFLQYLRTAPESEVKAIAAAAPAVQSASPSAIKSAFKQAASPATSAQEF